MCAIAGIISYQEPPEAFGPRVEKMLSALKHRGPDGGGVLAVKHAALGALRLSQVDREGGAQPMSSPCGRWHLVFNGEIHNHRELRARLASGWEFHTRSDTEVLLAALVRWGRDALPRLNGMFAFFVWDAQEQAGWAARDALGVKPLAWCMRPDGLAFASEAHALLPLLPGAPAVNVAAVLEHFVAPCFSGVRAPMFAGLHYLLPGQVLDVGPDGAGVESWFHYDLQAAVNDDADGLARLMRERLPLAVERTLDADETPALFLSGGLDSSLIAALAQARFSRPLKAFTIAYEGQASFDYARALMVKSDDLPYAVEVAREVGLEHHAVPVSRTRLAEDLRTLAVRNDALPAWEQELSQYHLARAAAGSGARAVLVGDAADETHYGYGFFLDDEATGHPSAMLRRFGHVPLCAAMRGAAADLIEGYATMARDAGHAPESRAGRLRGTTSLLVRLWLPRLLHNGDVHTMAHGLEARVPFADRDLLALAVTVHPELALRGGWEKWLLREAARGLMPETARTRRKSSLSKDDGTGPVLQAEARLALAESGPLISTWLDVTALHQLCHPGHTLTETERGLLFRVVCFHHWAVHHGIRQP